MSDEGAGRLAIAEAMIACYNAQNADAYVALMTADAAEASYRGAVLRDGGDGVLAGLKALFDDYPDNRVEILDRFVHGPYVVLRERVSRGEKKGSFEVEPPFDVLAIYSFEGALCSRVEFVR